MDLHGSLVDSDIVTYFQLSFKKNYYLIDS